MRRAIVMTMLTAIVTMSCTQPTRVEEGFLDVNGTSLFYKTMGRGDPIVVLHGGPGFDHRQFLPYIWELAAQHKVILFDQRGTGLSSGTIDAESISIDSFIADIEGVREAFGIEEINLLGHSWGGVLAMHYGIRHPEKLKSLILCSTTGSEKSFGEMRTNYEADRPSGDGELLQQIYASEEFQNGNPEAVERFWRIYFKPYFVDHTLVDAMDLKFTENTIKNSNQVAGLIFQSIGDFDLHEDLQAIECPTLVIHGDSDPLPVLYAEKIHDSIAGSELVIAKDSGHWLFVDATETFTSSILEFLKRCE
ncbi:MAG: alpha/beta hydrolase [bacterium]|nr:alpha/beta hydrolase [bacterium]